MSIILGLNSYHADSSACILLNGKLVAAAEEERFRRIKHWAGFPSQAIAYCLEEAKVKLNDVEHVAINSDPKSNFLKKIGFTVKNRPDVRFIIDKLRNKKKRASIEDELKKEFPNMAFSGKIHRVEHHLSHLASAFMVGPFDEAVVVSVDGFGDFSSTAWGFGKQGKIAVEERVLFPHSLGIFYQAMTQYLGFDNYGDEYKVMGLSPYGNPRFLESLRQVVILNKNGTFSLNLDCFRHHTDSIEMEGKGGSPVFGCLYTNTLEDLLGFSARKKNEPLEEHHHDLAKSIQVMYEEAFFNILNAIYGKYSCENLAIAGGCGMNSVANGKIYRQSPYKNTYIQSAAGDAGGAIGAAYIVVGQLGETKEFFSMTHAYWGPRFSNDYIACVLKTREPELLAADCCIEKIENDQKLCGDTAAAIADGLVIGWFQGRMEWGPRALGNRSILGDPRRADMKDILNLKIKRRESFRPFAPSILREAVSEWFEEDDDVPFMMKVFQIRKEQREKIPAVTHVDGSGRLQTVLKHTNPRYYQLIEAFQNITGIPMLLNTSFNENEPVVCKPEEALDCFLRTKMDVLVMEDYLIQRRPTDA